MITEDKYTCVCIHNLMLALVVNHPITGKRAKFRISVLPAHLLYNVRHHMYLLFQDKLCHIDVLKDVIRKIMGIVQAAPVCGWHAVYGQ